MEREEYRQLNFQLAKLGDVCAENGFRFRFDNDSYPVKIIISPDGSMDGQLSMLENPVRHNGAGLPRRSTFCICSFIYMHKLKDSEEPD